MNFFIYMFAGLLGAVIGIYTGRSWQKETSDEQMKLLKAEVNWYRKNSRFTWPGADTAEAIREADLNERW